MHWLASQRFVICLWWFASVWCFPKHPSTHLPWLHYSSTVFWRPLVSSFSVMLWGADRHENMWAKRPFRKGRNKKKPSKPLDASIFHPTEKIESCEGLVVDSRQGPLCSSVAGIACALRFLRMHLNSKQKHCKYVCCNCHIENIKVMNCVYTVYIYMYIFTFKYVSIRGCYSPFSPQTPHRYAQVERLAFGYR